MSFMKISQHCPIFLISLHTGRNVLQMSIIPLTDSQESLMYYLYNKSYKPAQQQEGSMRSRLHFIYCCISQCPE